MLNLSSKVATNNGLDGVLTLVASTSVFYNECEVNFRFDWRSIAELPPDVNVQVSFFSFYCHSPTPTSTTTSTPTQLKSWVRHSNH